MDKFYITTSIVYTNAPPHIGFTLELIQADVLARWNRQKGKEVFFLTGTDEHGGKIANKAREEGMEPQEFVDRITDRYKELIRDLSISNDDFIRTTDRRNHWPGVEKMWRMLEDSGDIYKKEYEGFYCIGCEAFLRESDLRQGKCVNHDREPERVKEENYFFRLSRYAERIRKAIENDEVRIIPVHRKKEMLRFIEEGLEDISVSRDKEKLQWGIPVPGDEDQVLYVWLDALTNYVSALGYGREERLLERFWPADVHCIGKDILRFHAVIWIGMLLSAGLDLPRSILVHGFINVEGRKMSKSFGNVIDPFDILDQYGPEATRYLLLRQIPTTEDGDFSHEKFTERYNTDLADGLGNLLSRTVALAKKNDVEPRKDHISDEIKEEINRMEEAFSESMNDRRFGEALARAWDLIHFADGYIEKQRPWEGGEEAKGAINDLLLVLLSLAEMIRPVMPDTAERIKGQIETKERSVLFPKL